MQLLREGIRRVMAIATLAVVLAGLVFAASTPAPVHAAALATSPCYITVVTLNGSNAPTVNCVMKSKPTGKNSTTPKIGVQPCGSNLPSPWVALYQNSWYGGAQICFAGTGSVNLTNYWINSSTSWNDQVSSMNMGAYGYLSTDINGNGNQCYFYHGTETSYINNYCGSGWNDVVSYVQIDS